MFSFKKSKGRRNIRKKETDDEEMAVDSGAADIIKRTATPKSESAAGKSSRPSLQIKELADERAEQSEDPRQYTRDDIQALKEETPIRQSEPASEAAYPFSSEGIPNAQDIYMAKKLRRQRQAAHKMNEEDSANEEDFISLADNMASSQIRGTDRVDLENSIAEGEDELDAVIIDKGERAEFGRIAKQAMEESIDHAHDDEMSEWENEQLRNAGIAAPPKFDARQASLPEDNGFKFDMNQFKFIIAQEKNQQAIEQDRLKLAKEKLAASSYALDELRQNIEKAQKQYDHFSSLAKTTV
ncbi:hypothetical protein IWW50_001759 [Coemansia erecta]|nr:hypothetical protein IWW50_001759 [Coemansia erecta]